MTDRASIRASIAASLRTTADCLEHDGSVLAAEEHRRAARIVEGDLPLYESDGRPTKNGEA
jgi:hypothetical protein